MKKAIFVLLSFMLAISIVSAQTVKFAYETTCRNNPDQTVWIQETIKLTKNKEVIKEVYFTPGYTEKLGVIKTVNDKRTKQTFTCLNNYNTRLLD